MVRESLMRRQEGDGFRWRGEEVWRVESFSDAVFAFAVTLLVVSLEVPRTFDELLITIRGFPAFAVCFVLLLLVWYEHYKYFRRYGLRDVPTVWLNSVLLFLVLLYVYPLKFLFTLVVDQLIGFGGVTETMDPSRYPLLMTIYGAGFVAVQLVFVLFYLRAYSLRAALKLDAQELSITRGEARGFVLNVLVGLASVGIALLGGEGAIGWAGWIYLLIIPVQIANGRMMGPRGSRKRSSAPASTAGDVDREEREGP